MEPNEITCPQCGLANNYLSEACTGCGIIFVKNPAMIQAQAEQKKADMQAQAEKDEQKRKAIEEAEAILEQSGPAPPNAISKNETIMRSYPAEDTIEMAIPVEHPASEIKPQASSTVEKKPDSHQEPANQEIEMEAIEASIEMVTDTTDAEELLLSEVKGDKSAEPTSPEAAEKPVEPATEREAAVEQSDKTANADFVEQGNKDQKQDDTAVKQPEAEPAADTKPEEDQKKAEPVAAESAEAEDAAAGVNEPGSSGVKNTDSTKPAEQEIAIEENPQLIVAEKTPIENEARTPAEPVKKQQAVETREETLNKQQEIQAREVLKKQRENQAKVEALKKEKAVQARAAVLKKKRLAQVKAEVLKKQKAAQAKAEALKKMKEAPAKAASVKIQKTAQARAEALKKQKDAQAKAEASAREIQVASTGVQEAVSQTTGESLNHHEKLLGLLKRYKGRAIGINYDNSTEIKEAELVDANEEFFSVMVKDKKLQFSYPLKSILTIVEGQEGVEIGPDDKKLKFNAVIKVYPLVSF